MEATPSPSQQKIAIAEEFAKDPSNWPKEAGPIQDYDRVYFWDTGDNKILRSQFKMAKDKGKGTATSVSDYREYVFDGGCSVVNLTFYSEGDPRNKLKCGGR